MTETFSTVALGKLAELSPSLSREGGVNESTTLAFVIANSAHMQRLTTASAGSVLEAIQFFVPPNALCGDAPDLYHPVYLMAVLSSQPFLRENGLGVTALPVIKSLIEANLPAVSFNTEEWTRRSMTLNGMRMSTEFFATGSLRVLELVKQRLAAGQRDVVHDVLVYLMRQVLQERVLADEERALRAESLSAFLGIDTRLVLRLLSTTNLNDEYVVEQLHKGYAGPLKRDIDLSKLVGNQLKLLRSELEIFSERETTTFELIDPIVASLYHGP